MKTCPACGVEKDASQFGKNKRRKDGLACYCRDCSRQKAREYARTPAQQAKRKAYYEANKGVLLAQAKERWEQNKEQYEPARQKWAVDNREKMLAYYADKGAAHRAFIDEIKEGEPCFDCRRVFAPYIMDFDHVQGHKVLQISDMWSWGREKVLAEIKKCELTCANCHRERTVFRMREAA